MGACVKQLTLSEHQRSPPVFSWVRAAPSFFSMLCDGYFYLSVCLFFFLRHGFVSLFLNHEFVNYNWYLSPFFKYKLLFNPIENNVINKV